MQNLEEKVKSSTIDIQELEKTILAPLQGASDAASLGLAKKAFVVAFKWLYVAAMDGYRQKYKEAGLFGRGSLEDPDVLARTERNLLKNLESIQLEDSLTESLPANQELSDAFVDSTFNLIETFLSPTKLQSDPRHNDFTVCLLPRDMVSTIELNVVNASIASSQQELAEHLSPMSTRSTRLSKETLERKFSILTDLINRAYQLEQKTKVLTTQSKQDYQNDKIAPVIPKDLFHIEAAMQRMEFIRQVKNAALSQLSPLSNQQASPAPVHVNNSSYSFAFHYADSAALAELFETSKLAELPAISAGYLAFKEFQRQLFDYFGEITISISASVAKLAICKEGEIFVLYNDLMVWRNAINFVLSFDQGKHIFTDKMQNALAKIDGGIEVLVQRLEKPLKEIVENFGEIEAKLRPAFIQQNVDFHKNRLASVVVMKATSIEETAVKNLLAQYRTVHLSALTALINARVKVLDKMYQSLYESSVESTSMVKLRELLDNNRKAYELECQFHTAIVALCAVHNYQDLALYNEKIGEITRCREEINYQIKDIESKVSRENLEGVLGALREQLANQDVVIPKFTELFNRLYIRVEAYRKIEVSVQNQTIDQLFDGYVASLLPETFYGVKSLENPAEYLMPQPYYQMVLNVQAAINASNHAQRQVVKKNLDAFSAARSGLLNRIAQLKVALEAENKAILGCTAETFLGVYDAYVVVCQNIFKDFMKYDLDDSTRELMNIPQDPTNKVGDPSLNFMNGLMKSEMGLHHNNGRLLLQKKKAFEKAYDDQIAGHATSISITLDTALDGHALQHERVSDSMKSIAMLWQLAEAQGLNPPTMSFQSKFLEIEGKITRLIEKRKVMLASLQRVIPEQMNMMSVATLKKQLDAEKTYHENLKKVLSQFPAGLCNLDSLTQQSKEYLNAIDQFERDLINLEFKFVFTQEIMELENLNRDSLNALDEDQQQTLINTLESLSQIVVARQRSHPSDQDPLIGRARSILVIMSEHISRYHQETLDLAWGWLSAPALTVRELTERQRQFDRKVQYYDTLYQKMDGVARVFGESNGLPPLVDKTLSDVLKANSLDLALTYQGNINLINIQKWKLIKQIFQSCQAHVHGARCWTTATGINEMRGLEKSWNKLGDQQLSNLDYYLGRIKKIVDERLIENPDNEELQRTVELHQFYLDSQTNIEALYVEQNNYWLAASQAALKLHQYENAQKAFMKLKLTQEYLFIGWVNLTSSIIVNLFTSEIPENQRAQQIINAIKAAKKATSSLPLDQQLDFYNKLIVALDTQSQLDMSQVKKVLFLMKALDDANDPERENHAYFGRATGVEEIVQDLPSPELCLHFMSEKSRQEPAATLWQWVDELISQLMEIISTRIQLTKEKTSRHEETQKFYVSTLQAHTALFPQLNIAQSSKKALDGNSQSEHRGFNYNLGASDKSQQNSGQQAIEMRNRGPMSAK